MEVVTKDTNAISDAELAEMADLCIDREPRFDIGYLSKVREEWVLISTAREGNKLRGYSFSTLERIGGTPCLLVGLALIDRNAKSEQALKALLADQFRRALLAFPDEEVLLGTRLLTDHGYRAFQGLEDVVPRHEHKPTGEERAWARRLAKRFGNEKDLDDRTSSPPRPAILWAALTSWLPRPSFLRVSQHSSPTCRPTTDTGSWSSAGPCLKTSPQVA